MVNYIVVLRKVLIDIQAFIASFLAFEASLALGARLVLDMQLDFKASLAFGGHLGLDVYLEFVTWLACKALKASSNEELKESGNIRHHLTYLGFFSKEEMADLVFRPPTSAI